MFHRSIMINNVYSIISLSNHLSILHLTGIKQNEENVKNWSPVIANWLLCSLYLMKASSSFILSIINCLTLRKRAAIDWFYFYLFAIRVYIFAERESGFVWLNFRCVQFETYRKVHVFKILIICRTLWPISFHFFG